MLRIFAKETHELDAKPLKIVSELRHSHPPWKSYKIVPIARIPWPHGIHAANITRVSIPRHHSIWMSCHTRSVRHYQQQFLHKYSVLVNPISTASYLGDHTLLP